MHSLGPAHSAMIPNALMTRMSWGCGRTQGSPGPRAHQRARYVLRCARQAAHRGLEDRRVKLGCVMPGESPAVFGDALRRLAGAATYLYQDGVRYWYSTQPTVTKLADDRAEQYKP